MSIFVGRKRKNRKFPIRRQGFLETGCDRTHSAPSVLHFVPRCLQSALSRRPKLYFAAGGIDTLELISNWTARSYNFILKSSIIGKCLFFQDYRGIRFRLTEIDIRFGLCRSKYDIFYLNCMFLGCRIRICNLFLAVASSFWVIKIMYKIGLKYNLRGDSDTSCCLNVVRNDRASSELKINCNFTSFG